MAEQLDALHHRDTGVEAALQAEGEDGTRALGHVFAGQLMVRAGRQARIVDPGDGWVALQEFRDFHRIGAVAFHAERQRLDAGDGQEGVHRLLVRPQVAQADGVAVNREGQITEGLVEA